MDFLLADYNMSLTYFILNGFQANPDYYSCPDDLALRPIGIRRPFWGAYFFLSGICILILYSICFVAIATSDLMKTPAYKTMFVLGIYDISSTCMHSIATGILGYYGIAFCDYPRLNIIFGFIALGSWMGCCITSMTLAVIRICDVCHLKIQKLFEGRKIYFFLSPILYINVAQIFNNMSMASGTVILYGYLFFLIAKKPGGSSNEFSKYKVNVLLQAFFFCVFHFICALMYTYMQYISAPACLILVGQVTWQMGTGSVCIVYLTLNRSIRKAVTHMIYPKTLLKVAQAPNVVSSDSRALDLQIHRHVI